ncbi:MAG: saccharopine dehydrogenase family protein [Promethearchaeota archaeon]
MKVLALGGSGDMGRMAVAVLLDFPDLISSITVADKDLEQSKVFVELVGSDKLKAVEIDVTNRDNIVKMILEHDLVMNTVGPFYKFEVPILEAVIEAKKNYLDICDDWKPTLDALEFDDEVKDAGITAIIGIGASPGITNIMAVHACSKLDYIDNLVTAWGAGVDANVGKKPKYFVRPEKLAKRLNREVKAMEVTSSEERANAATMHLLKETIEKIPTYMDNKIVEIDPLTETENRYDFPGFKDVYTVHIGHPEPVTLPRTLKANTVSNIMYIGETATEITRKYSQQIKSKKLTIEEAAIGLGKEWGELGERALKDQELANQYVGGPPTLSVITTGTKDGKRKKVGVALNYVPYGGMAGVTSIPLGIATIMFIEGKITQKGVLTPEEVFKNNPMEFFNRIAPYCGKNLKGKDILIEREVEL